MNRKKSHNQTAPPKARSTQSDRQPNAAGARSQTRSEQGKPLHTLMEALRQHLPDLRKRYGVCSLSVFGSFVRGGQQRGSDLDLLVEFQQDTTVTLLDFMRLENELSDLLNLKVDLVERAGLKSTISRRLLEEALAV